MTEVQLVQTIEAATAQLVLLFGQIIAINFTMIIAIYYFLHRAVIWLKLSAFLLYLIGSIMFLLFAVRESNVIVATREALQGLPEPGPVAIALLEFGDSSISDVLSILTNILYWAMMVAIGALLFFWRRPPEQNG